MTSWVVMDNPDWPKQRIEAAKRGELKPACHDKTPYLDLRCDCGQIGHVHASQLQDAMKQGATEIGTFCFGCGEELVLPIVPVLLAINEAWGIR